MSKSFLRSYIRIFFVGLLFSCTQSVVIGQERVKGHSGEESAALKLKTLLVQIPVIVSDLGGRYVADLRKEGRFFHF